MEVLVKKQCSHAFFLATSIASALFLVLSPSTASASVLAQPANNLGLIGFWSFEDAAGSLVTDFSGKGNRGALTNMDTATDWVAGKRGKALDFDGTDDYVAVSTMPALDSTGIVSFSAWVKPASVGNGRTLVSTTSGGATGVLWRLESNFMYFWPNTNVDPAQSATFTYVAGEWTHLAVTHDEGTNTTTFWRNGAVVTTSSAAAFGGTLQNTTGLAIGSYNSSNYFSGIIDEFRIYNRALTTAEASGLYAKTGAVKISASQNNFVSSGLVGFWSFNSGDVSGSTAYDRSVIGNNGALTNSPTTGTAKIGSGLLLDGTDDYVEMASASVYGYGAGDFTWAGWIYPERINDSYEMIWAQNSGIPYFAVRDNVLHFYLSDTFEAGTVEANQWQHVAVRRTSGVVEIFKNGAKQNGSSTQSGSISTGQGWIGRYGTTASHYFKGKIDEVRIYNRALPDAEILALHSGIATKVSTSQNTIAPSSLVGWWTFDGPDLNTTTSTDRSGQGLHGTLTNGPAAIGGKVGQALRFDGVDDYVAVADNANLDFGTGAFTMAGWVKAAPSAKVDYLAPFGKSNASGVGYWFHTDSSGRVRLGTAGAFIITGTSDVMDNQWHHIAFTRFDTTATLYVDGLSEGATSNSTNVDSDDQLWIGALANFGRYWNGSIDDVRVYNKALTAAEMLALYNSTK